MTDGAVSAGKINFLRIVTSGRARTKKWIVSSNQRAPTQKPNTTMKTLSQIPPKLYVEFVLYTLLAIGIQIFSFLAR